MRERVQIVYSIYIERERKQSIYTYRERAQIVQYIYCRERKREQIVYIYAYVEREAYFKDLGNFTHEAGALQQHLPPPPSHPLCCHCFMIFLYTL